MKSCYFEIKVTPVGRYYFLFKSNDSEAIVVSSSFLNRSSLEECISKIRSHACLAQVICLPETSHQRPLFIINGDDEHAYSFSLIGFNDEIIMQSKSYPSIDNCNERIVLIKEAAMESKIVDSTY